MVRVGGMSYACDPDAAIGARISDLTFLASGEPIEPSRAYVVAGWASVNEDVEGPPVYELMEKWFGSQKTVSAAEGDTVDVIGR